MKGVNEIHHSVLSCLLSCAPEALKASALYANNTCALEEFFKQW